MKINFIVQGKVQAKQRPRFNGKFAYTPKETVAYETLVKINNLEVHLDKEKAFKDIKYKIWEAFIAA